MLKLKFIPTGIVFILPDEDAIKIKNADRTGDYKILDKNSKDTKNKNTKTKTVKDLVVKDKT